jgi:hypothetical protein
MITLLAMLSARAQEDYPACEAPPLTAPPSALSVAWVSPLGRRARGSSWLYVVPTADLRGFAHGEGKEQVGRTLQWLGLRKNAKNPHRRYKVVVFDTTPEELCRPLWSDDAVVDGVRVCDENRSGPDGAYEGCGWATDLSDGEPSIQVYRAQWRLLAVDGFCVLPLDRFLSR